MESISKKKSQNKKKIDWTVADRIISVYDKYFYTLTSKILLHVALWFVYYMLQLINVSAQYSISLLSASVFAFRNILISISSFYLLIYILIPVLFLKKRYILFFLSCILLFWIDNSINYLLTKFVYQNLNITDPVIISYVRKLSALPISYLLLFKNVMQMFWAILYISSLPILLKLSFDFMVSINKKAQLEKDNLLLELNFLKSQLNPHFLFNALNNIYSLCYKKDEKAADLVLQLSDLMRYTLYETNTESVLLKKEIEFLYNYIELERVRYNKQTHIEFTTDCEEDNIKNVNIAPLVFFSFVENAFKHGINSTVDHAWVKVFISFKDRVLLLKVANSYNGTVMEELTTNKKIGGIGIENAQKRLSLLYPDRYNLKIEKTESVFEILLSINLA